MTNLTVYLGHVCVLDIGVTASIARHSVDCAILGILCSQVEEPSRGCNIAGL